MHLFCMDALYQTETHSTTSCTVLGAISLADDYHQFITLGNRICTPAFLFHPRSFVWLVVAAGELNWTLGLRCELA